MANEVRLAIAATQVFGMTPRRYQQLAAEGIVPSAINGMVDFISSAKAVIAYYKKLAAGQGSLTLTDQRARLTQINADRKRLELDRARGQVIQTTTAMMLWGGVCNLMRAKLLAIPSKAPLIYACKSLPEAKEALEKLIWEVLQEIANPDLESVAGMGGDNKHPPYSHPAGKTKRRGVGRPKQSPKL